MKYWIDPPSGWQYGFPKIWDDNEITLKDLLLKSGYPKKDVEFAMGYMRMWDVEDKDKNASK